MHRKLALIIFSALSISLLQAGDTVDSAISIQRISGSLAKRVERAANDQPKQASEKFVVPTQEQQKAWKQIVEHILGRRTKSASKLLKRNSFPHKLIRFTDDSNGREYMLLQEDPVVSGWGLFIFDLNTKNPLVIEVPHPVSDSGTELQGIEAFLETGARAFVLSGTHRRANGKLSPCTQATEQSNYGESDPAHNVNSMFHVTHETLVETKPDTIVVQLHGMRERDVCPNVFLSTGTKNLTSNASKFLDCLTARDVETGIYDGETSTCPLIASTNVQGRFSNGIRKDACRTYAEGSPEPGFFIHVEQEPNIRSGRDAWQPVIEALKCAFPPTGAK